ncbi:hypothetical protein M0R89_17065 [Halorussus limi]|uniref:Uncharacterized protein n=1 Tax=Halorussus limi TaxID=2938695 RepID=A0A8U0HT52_9EURY|nr:hypothetical protein [Halorussus limi]UPV74235.1 hypothetical protein M0R89_17065 [Halorussus limi]
MDDALRKRLDAIVGLLAVVVLLLAGVVVGLGGGRFPVGTLLFGFIFALVGVTVWTDFVDRIAPSDSVSGDSVSDES